MKLRLLTGVLLAVLMSGWFSAVAQAAEIWQPGFAYTTVVNDPTLDNPTALEAAAGGRIYISERTGRISLATAGGGARQTVATVPVDSSGERGLLNIALDADQANYPFMYAYYTGTDSKLHIGKLPVNSDGTLGALTDIFVGNELFNQYHNGGGLDADLQGHIFFSIGENYKPQLAQDPTVENGKVMRINRDGGIPADNPYLNAPGSLPALYAVGLRNPFRLSVDTATGKVFVGDVGSDYAEEINQILPGKNYGWPEQEGDRCPNPCTFERPLYFYRHGTTGRTIILGPTYHGSAYPASQEGRLFFGDWMVGLIDTMNPAAPPDLANFSTGNGNILDLDLGPDGKMYFIEHYSGKVIRIDYPGGVTQHDPVANPTCTPNSGPAPLTTTCAANASDEDGDTLSYQWDFSDGSTSTLANPAHTFTAVGAKTVHLTVSDGHASIGKAVVVQVGVAPTVQITQPDDTHLYRAGEQLNYAVTAQDSAGNDIPNDKVSVKINLHHDEHEHDLMLPAPGKTGSTTLPVTGETSPNIFYRIYATATDASGLTATTTRDVSMLKTSLTLKTSLDTGELKLDGTPVSSGTTIQGVAGMERGVEAPATLTDANGKLYTFASWSDGGARSHSISFPGTDATLTATYTPQAGNLIKNPSLDMYATTQHKPTFWRLSRWNDMQSAFDFTSSGRNGSGGCQIKVTAATLGSSSFCHPDPLAVTPGKKYSFTNWYKSDAFTAVFALFMNDSGMYQFEMLAAVPPSDSWQEQKLSFTPPAGAQRFTIFQNIYTNGQLTTDDYQLFEQ